MSPRTLTRKLSLTAAAFGLTSLGAISLASATPASTEPQTKALPYGQDDGYDDEPYWDEAPAQPDYDLDDDGFLEHTEIDYRHYDRDRDGALDRGERAAYWNHMVDTGKLGPDLTRVERVRLARLAHLIDRDSDGRLNRSERRALTRIVRAQRIFAGLDRNQDGTLTRREVGLRRYGPYDRHYGPYDRYDGRQVRPIGAGRSDWSAFHWSPFRRSERVRPNNWIAARFDILDRNDNGRVSWGEVESHFLARLGGRF